MTLINDLREAVKDELAATFDRADVETHAGRFDLGELKKFIARAPAIRIAVLGVDQEDAETGDGDLWQVRMGAFIVTKDTAKAGEGRINRDAAALNMVTAALPIIRAGRFGENIMRADRVRARNLHTDSLQEYGATLWAIEWRHRVALEDSVFLEDGVVPHTVYLGFAPEIGLGHEDDYIQIGGDDES